MEFSLFFYYMYFFCSEKEDFYCHKDRHQQCQGTVEKKRTLHHTITQAILIPFHKTQVTHRLAMNGAPIPKPTFDLLFDSLKFSIVL